MSRSRANTARVLDADTMHSLDLAGIKLIEASAGTGKTHAITSLYLRHVLQGRAVSGILVVTFTNAATEELRGRVRQRLYDTLQAFKTLRDTGQAPATGDGFLGRLLAGFVDDDTELEQSINHLKLAVRSMDEAAIYTIHGFCQRALSDHAFHSGQAYEVNLVHDDSPLWEEALKDWWRRNAYELAPVDRELFRSALGEVERFMHRQRPLRAPGDRKVLPETREPLEELYQQWRQLLESLSGLERTWRERGEELREILLESPALSRKKGNGYKREELEPALKELDAWFEEGRWQRIHPDFELLSAEKLDAESKPAKRGTDERLRDPFFEECARVLTRVRRIEQQFLITALQDAGAFAAAQVETRKQKQRLMSFHDQLTRLRDALHGRDGPHLALGLRRAFPVAMIDEFQDTDSVQYDIFRTLYENGDPDSALTMIGDPKQAIYSFRGGDIFTYMRARRDAGEELYTLDTNWRSVPGLIQAVNTFFRRRPQAFIYDEAIGFTPVRPAADKEHRPLLEHGKEVTPLSLWRLPFDEKKQPLGKGDAEALLHQRVADEILRLIRAGREGSATLGNESLRPGDIAVLVREKNQGNELGRALAERGVPAVSVSTDKVFDSDQARGLLRLLRGVVHCSDRQYLREALASNLLRHDYREMAALVDNEAAWLRYSGDMRELHQLWQQKGFMVMFQTLMQRLSVGERLANSPDGERALTNVLHLAELLQKSARSHPGMDALLAWFQGQMEDGSEEEAELRLESDENLVKIVTIHASKGLQYPVVFVPYLSTGRSVARDRGNPLPFHDSSGRPCIDLSPDPEERHLHMAEKERLAEDVRILYVAATRAQAHLCLAWGQVGRGGGNSASARSALGWLLYHRQNAEDLDEQYPDALSDVSPETFDEPLRALERDGAGQIRLQSLPGPFTADPLGQETAAGPLLRAAEFTGHIATDWRIASFSALTRDVHQAPHGGSPRGGEDAVLDFPAGSHVGLFLHAMLEELDFQGDVREQALRLHQRHAGRFGIDAARHQDTVVRWLENIVHSPLDEGGLRLADLSPAQRLDELPFDFSVGHVDIQALDRELSALAGRALEPLSGEAFTGLITGIIDLVFEHRGRFYIADYKSNYLGGALDDYAPRALHKAVCDRRYDLQYLLYALALHRYLGQRLSDYEYRRHFGGVYYLFLRGMRPQHGPACGVYFRRPEQAAIDSLESVMGRATQQENG